MDNQEKFVVYKYTNIHNGLIYIGITSKTLDQRWQSGYHSNKRLCSDIKKYGKGGFSKEILHKDLTISEAKDLEIKEIASQNATNPNIGYNQKTGGTVGMYGHKHTEETKKNFSISRTGENNSFYGKSHTNQADWSNAHKVICLNTMKIYNTIADAKTQTGISTIEHCVNGEQLSAGTDEYGNKLYWYTYQGENYDYKLKLIQMKSESEKASRICKPVRCIETGEIFSSTIEAGKAKSKTNSFNSVSRCCRGERKTAYGYHWEFITDKSILKNIQRNYGTKDNLRNKKKTKEDL